jgi:hypothetical protein
VALAVFAAGVFAQCHTGDKIAGATALLRE